MITIEVRSPSELMQRIHEFALNYPDTVARICDEKFGVIMAEAQQQTPVRTGRLKGSGLVEPAEVTDGMISISLGFHTKYAIYVHENLETFHKIGKAKFLEDPLMAHLQTLPQELVDAVEERMSE